MSAFIDISIFPSYGKTAAVLMWNLHPDYSTYSVFVYRSSNGTHDWVLLNDGAPVVGGSMYRDGTLPRTEFHRNYQYRLLLVKGDEHIPSAPVGFHEKLKRSEYAAARTFLLREYLRMRAGNGVRVFHYSPISNGTPLPGFDAETDQHIGFDCPPEEGQDGPGGTNYVGGYGKPWQTWVELQNIGPMITQASEDGTGMESSQKVKTRFLAYPRPSRNDLIINPITDERYIVMGEITPYFFKGVCPLAYEADITKLARDDPRFKIIVPALKPDGSVPMP